MSDVVRGLDMVDTQVHQGTSRGTKKAGREDQKEKKAWEETGSRA